MIKNLIGNRFWTILLGFSLILSVSGFTFWNNSTAEAIINKGHFNNDDEVYRIVLDAAKASKAGVKIRHNLGNGRVSADLTSAQLGRLTQLGITYERVPKRTVAGSANGKGKPVASTVRVIPSTQVPYGIKMIYGNPNLTLADVYGGNTINVAVLDTGAINHPDFTRIDGSKVITKSVDFSQRRFNQVEDTAVDKYGHGTHVIGTIAAAGGIDGKGIFGVAPQVSIFNYKVLNDQGFGYADDIARAIIVAADRGANIISMSLGSSSPSPDELNAINYAVETKHVLVIAAAGNEGPNSNTIGYPASYANVVAVASLNRDEIVSEYSSRGISDGYPEVISEREVEVAGPGRNVLSTYKDGGYVTISGTSMATPHIAGLAAKIWQGTADSTRNWLDKAAKGHDITAAETINNAEPGYDIAAGYGLPQVTPLKQSLWNN